MLAPKKIAVNLVPSTASCQQLRPWLLASTHNIILVRFRPTGLDRSAQSFADFTPACPIFFLVFSKQIPHRRHLQQQHQCSCPMPCVLGKSLELLVGTTLVTNKLVASRTTSLSFPGGVDYPTYWVSILVGRLGECGMPFFFIFGRGALDLGGLIWLASVA